MGSPPEHAAPRVDSTASAATAAAGRMGLGRVSFGRRDVTEPAPESGGERRLRQVIRIDAGGWGLTWAADGDGVLHQVGLGAAGHTATLDVDVVWYPLALPTYGGGDADPLLRPEGDPSRRHAHHRLAARGRRRLPAGRRTTASTSWWRCATSWLT